MKMHLATYLTRLLGKATTILQSPLAWIAGLGLFVADSYSRGKLTVYMVVVACVVDLICGIAVSIKRKKFTRSDLMRLTVEKLLVYGLVMLVFLCIDGWIAEKTEFEFALSSSLIGILITLTEAVSFTASLLILFPKNAFLYFLRKLLRAELASKLGIDESEVDAALSQARRDKPARAKNGQFVKKEKK